MAAPPVLLVADDLAIIASVKRVLAREGYECVLATNAADAIIAWGHSLPGLVLLQPSVESDRGGVVLEELQNHPDAQLLRVVQLGEAVPGFAWPVEPLPIDSEHLTKTIDAQIRSTDEGAQWAVYETTSQDTPPENPPLPVNEEPEAWRATSPQPVTVEEAAQQDVPDPEPIPVPSPPERGVSAELEERLFGDLAADVEASALESVESSLPPMRDDDELQRLEDDVRAEAQRRRQAREAHAVTVKPVPPTPPTPTPATTLTDESEASFEDLSEAPALPPSRATAVLSRAEQMVLEGRAQNDAELRTEEADAREQGERENATLRRAEHAEDLVRRERDARSTLEEESVALRDEVKQLTTELAAERDASDRRLRDEEERASAAQRARNELEEQVASLRDELSRERSAGAQTQTTSAASQAEVERLRTELTAAQELRAGVEASLQSAQAELERLRNDAQTAATQLEALETRHAGEAQQRAEAERALAEARAQLEIQERHLAETRKARDEAQAEMLASEELRERLQGQLSELTGRVEGLTADVTSASELLEETARERDGLRSRIAALEPVKELAEKVTTELDAEKKRNEELEATVELASEKVKKLEAREIMPVSLPGNRAVGLSRHDTVGLDGLARVVSQLVLASVEAKLELGVPGGVRTLWFKRGQIIAAESNIDHESLLTRARRDGLIDNKQEAELRMLRGAPPREQLDALKARSFIRDIESVPLVQRYTEQVALDSFTEEITQYRIVDETPPPETLLATVPRPTLPMLAESLRRAIAPDVLLEKLGGGQAVATANESELDLRALGFSERERKMLSWVDGDASVEDLSLASGLKPDAAFRALLVAQYLGLIDVKPGTRKTESTSGQLDVNRLEAKYDEVQDADYFTILGLPRVAGGEDVKRAFQRLSQEFDPLRYSGHPDPALQQRAQIVARLLEEAARALEDDRRRAEYARHLLD
ncbi:MAG: hypothetical protein ACO1OB_04290 [Archangium sp.]